MKTTLNINRNASTLITVIAALAFTTTGNLQASKSEEQAAIERLDRMSLSLEESIRYKTPVIHETESCFYNDTKVCYADVNEAAIRLEEFVMATEESVKYQAPKVGEDIENYEIQAARERLENLNLTLEETLRYQAPAMTEDIVVYELSAALDRLESYTLAVEQSIKF
jgi:hypothetical protein